MGYSVQSQGSGWGAAEDEEGHRHSAAPEKGASWSWVVCEWPWAAASCSEMESFRHTDGGKGGVYLMPEATGTDEVTPGRQWRG